MHLSEREERKWDKGPRNSQTRLQLGVGTVSPTGGGCVCNLGREFSKGGNMQWAVSLYKLNLESDACFYDIGTTPWIILVVISTHKAFLGISLGYNLIKLKPSLPVR